jgi:hypothetical protein
MSQNQKVVQTFIYSVYRFSECTIKIMIKAYEFGNRSNKNNKKSTSFENKNV